MLEKVIVKGEKVKNLSAKIVFKLQSERALHTLSICLHPQMTRGI